MSQTKCSYHPENIAVDICERCQRPICLTGKRVHHRRHSSGTGSTRHSWSTRHVYCPPCNADVKTDAATGPLAVGFKAIWVIVGSVVTIIFFSVGGALGFIALAVLGLGIYGMMQDVKKADAAREDEKEFLSSLKSSPKGVKSVGSYSKTKSYLRPDKAWQLTEVSCFSCGDAINLRDNFCVTCGSSTIDEKEKYGLENL